MRIIFLLASLLLSVVNAYSVDVYIKTTINGNVIDQNTIPVISYSDDCLFELSNGNASDDLVWEMRIGLDDRSGAVGTTYFSYNKLTAKEYPICFKQLDTTIGLPENNTSTLVWHTENNLLPATIVVSNNYGWSCSKAIYINFAPASPIVKTIDVVTTYADSTVTAVDVSLSWNTPESDVMPIQVYVEFCMEDGDKVISCFDAPGEQSTTVDYLCDKDWIRIYARNRYATSPIVTLFIKDYLSGVQDITYKEEICVINYYNLNGHLVLTSETDENVTIHPGVYIKETIFKSGKKQHSKVFINR